MFLLKKPFSHGMRTWYHKFRKEIGALLLKKKHVSLALVSHPILATGSRLNASTTPITAVGCQQCLSLSVVQLEGLFVCYDFRPDMFQSHNLAVVITPPLGVFNQIVCVLALSSLH